MNRSLEAYIMVGMEDRAARIVVVEDDVEIGSMVCELLGDEGWDAAHVTDAQALDDKVAETAADLLILDINLPGEDGLSICRRLSVNSDSAILMLTARSEDVDVIIGLEIGADDYLGKPFNPRELVARVRALLRRRKKNLETHGDRDQQRLGPLTIRFAARSVVRNGQRLPLSATEYRLLTIFAEAPGRVMSRDHLLESAHGRAAGGFDRSIDMLVCRLRKKIDKGEPSLIESVRNEGYVLRVPET
ncbi:MAG: response regulator transcription factor [Myxococcota bacterium]